MAGFSSSELLSDDDDDFVATTFFGITVCSAFATVPFSESLSLSESELDSFLATAALAKGAVLTAGTAFDFFSSSLSESSLSLELSFFAGVCVFFFLHRKNAWIIHMSNFFRIKIN